MSSTSVSPAGAAGVDLGDHLVVRAVGVAVLAEGGEAAGDVEVRVGAGDDGVRLLELLEREGAGDFVPSNPLMKDLKYNKGEGWKNPAMRDFFYFLQR